MIIEDYVSFEIAKLLKEKGFDEKCYVNYSFNGEEQHFNYCTPSDGVACSTLQMAIKWLREVHNLHVFTAPVFEDVEYQPGEWQEEMTGYRYEIVNINPNSKIIKDYPKIRALTPESAYEAAIKYCLEKMV